MYDDILALKDAKKAKICDTMVWEEMPPKNLVPLFKVMFQVVGENYGCKIISEP